MLYVCTNCNRTTIICKIFKLVRRTTEKRIVCSTINYNYKCIPFYNEYHKKLLQTQKKKTNKNQEKKNYILLMRMHNSTPRIF